MCMSHVTCEWVMSWMNESWHIWIQPYLSSHGTHVNESWNTTDRVLAHTWTNQFRVSQIGLGWTNWFRVRWHVKDSCRIWIRYVAPERVISYVTDSESYCIWMSYASYEYVNESCRTWGSHIMPEWVIPHMNESQCMCMYLRVYLHEFIHFCKHVSPLHVCIYIFVFHIVFCVGCSCGWVCQTKISRKYDTID